LRVEKGQKASRRRGFPVRGGVVACVVAAALCGCSSGPPKAPVIAEAYVGPAELKLRKDIPLDSGVAAVVHGGERLEIIQQRRGIFLKVRARNGAEGWTEARQLLSPQDMANVVELRDGASKLPPQGVATTYSDLGVHAQPSASTPAFLVLKAEEKFEVLGHVAAPRVGQPRPPLVPPPPPKKPKPAAKPKAKGANAKVPPPPLPAAPRPPENWLDMSRTETDPDLPPAPVEEPPKPVIDDWSLIKTPAGQYGWVLTRRLFMAVPDDVAQYAEGRRIVSYFSLGAIEDGDQTKHHWLWTTISASGLPYDFDGFRVFVWSLKRHRYETAYAERNLKGYSPVELREVTLGGQKGQPAQQAQGFSLCVEKSDGRRYRRNFAFTGGVVRLAGEQDCQAPPPLPTGGAPVVAAPNANAQQAASGPGLGARIRNKWTSLMKKWFGR
jgi:hypothetical protein